MISLTGLAGGAGPGRGPRPPVQGKGPNGSRGPPRTAAVPAPANRPVEPPAICVVATRARGTS
eukprot:scaffold5471_cov188-Prasinococcus_capsulatus_cf.AAC.1